jgi:protocatechuate 3,4-dioxygenase beta subunit
LATRLKDVLLLKKWRLFILIFSVTAVIKAVHGNDFIVDTFNPLRQTPSALIFDNLSKPSSFNKNNNLTRPTGSFKIAVGEPLYVKGKVTDVFRVPVDGVIIKIWHANAAGYYQTLLNKNSDFYDPSFLGSGQCITNNMGNYEFLTIFPGFYDDRAPHINLIASHRKFGIIETEVYFEKHPRNLTDPIYLSYTEDERAALTGDTSYIDVFDIKKGKMLVFNIVMDGVHQYKKF